MTEAAWTPTLAVDDLWEGEMVGFRAGEADILLVNLGAEGIRAYDNRCPHAGSRLSEGSLRAGRLECAAHLWVFDARSGHGVNPQTCQLKGYAVKVVDGTVFVAATPRTAR